jgi:hypothetical protein
MRVETWIIGETPMLRNLFRLPALAWRSHSDSIILNMLSLKH